MTAAGDQLGNTELQKAAAGLAGWLRAKIEDGGAEGAVVGLSGGVDSALVGALCRTGLGRERCLGVIMPCHSQKQDVDDAVLLAQRFDIPAVTVSLDEPYDRMMAILEGAHDFPAADEARRRLAAANLKPRLRMMTLYYLANLQNRLVVGTGNRSELAVGYFTKHGDGGVDLLPIGGLIKEEVFLLARHLQVPEEILRRPPSAGLWEGQTDEAEMGLTYQQLDAYLATGHADEAVRRRVDAMNSGSRHKRVPPPVGPRIEELLAG
ncbi:MAG: NAD(+) synthase [Thermaerobacterales bacterium]